MTAIDIILGIIILILLILLIHKNNVDNTAQKKYNEEINQLKIESNRIEQQIEYAQQRLQEAQEKYNNIVEQYKLTVANNQSDLDSFFASQKLQRQAELDQYFEHLQTENYNKLEKDYQQTYNYFSDLKIQAEHTLQEAQSRAKIAEVNALAQEDKFLALLKPLQLYEKEQQDKLFYTVQVPEEYKSDIKFLLTTVAQKVQHPDIINKLIWAEYVKPYLEDTFKRVGIEDKPGIYKLTNIINRKSYIGKSTHMKKRISDHFKSAIGIQAIADQAVHHIIRDTGFWNWSIEYIIYCDKDKLNEMEKYYINFFKTQEFGYNKNAGGGG